jgi:autotransporter-associated beta strand protein
VARGRALISAAVTALLIGSGSAASAQQRLVGIDVSDWQNQNGPTGDTPINWTTVAAPVSAGGGGKSFAFIRSSRGGTTGTYNEQDRTGTLSQRYDDFAFVYNITNATAQGMYAGPYHFGRADVAGNTGTDEANHMFQQSGAWMKPGYLLPVFDFEAGSGDLTTFANDFGNRIFQLTGVFPAIYTGQSYAQAYTGSNTGVNPSVAVTMPHNWVARWPNQIYNDVIDIQNIDPVPSPVTANVYGVWNASYPLVGTPQPWKFWQYGSRGRVAGIGANAVDVDLDLAHGGIEYLRDMLVPALWMSDASGDWSDISKWNSNNAGYVAGNDATGPAPRRPGEIATTNGTNDTVILNRTSANPIITFSNGNTTIRKLIVGETFNITGGSLTIGYVPQKPRGGDIGAGPISAQFSNDVTISGGGAFNVHTLLVDATRTLTMNVGNLTFNTIDLASSATTPAKLAALGTVNIAGLNGGTATIISSGGLTSGSVDLLGAVKSFNVTDGAAEIDFQVNVPITNGTLVKAGAGTMALAGANTFTGATITGGTLIGTTATIPGNIANSAALVFNQTSAGTYANAISGNGSLAKRGSGAITFSGANGFTGPAVFADSSVTLSGAAGSMSAASSYTLNAAAMLLSNAGANNNNRMSTGGISLNAGTLSFSGNGTTEAAGNVSAVSGASTVSLSGSGTSALNFGSLSRSQGATINFEGMTGSLSTSFSSGATPNTFIDQGTFANGNDYAIYDGVGKIAAMATGAGANEYATSITAGRHVKLSASASGVATNSIQTLNLASAAAPTLTLASNATLTLNRGGIIKSLGGAGTIAGGAGSSVTAPADVEYVINTAGATDALTISIPVKGGAGLTKTGSGTLTLTGANTYNGPTAVIGGVLVANAANLGGGDLQLSGGGRLQTTITSTGRNVALGAGGGAINGGTWYGTFSGMGGLSVTGGGDLVLNGVGNTYSGPTTVNSGMLSAGAANLGDGSSSNTLILNNFFGLRTLGPINTSRAVTMGVGGGGLIDTNGYDSTFSGAVGGPGGFIKLGAGTLVLNGAASSYPGGTQFFGGTVVAGPNDLGDGSATNTFIFNNGGRLKIADNFVTSRGVSMTGAGAIDTDGYAMTISGQFSNGSTFTKAGYGPLSLTNINSSFTGQAVLNNGTLRLAGGGVNGGALAQAAGYTINGGAVLKLDNATAAGGSASDRLKNTAPITMNGGSLWLYGAPTTETAGNLNVASGYNNIILNGSSVSILNLGAYSRSAGAALTFLTATSSFKTTFTSGVTAGSFIDQGVFVGGNYAVYDATGYVRAMISGAGDSDFSTTVQANRHVKLSATTSGIIGSIYTLNIAGSSTALTETIATGAALTLSKGGILSVGTGGVTITGGAGITTAVTTEFVIQTPDTGDLLTISTPITGGSGLTKSGLGRLSLNSTGNAYGGTTTIAGGTLRLSIANVIPDASNLVIGPDAQFDLATRAETVGNLTMYDGRVVSYNSSIVASGGTLTLNGASPSINYIGAAKGAVIAGSTLGLGTAAGTTSITVADGDAASDLSIRANVTDGTGSHAITKLGAGTLEFAGTANSFTGNVSVAAGTLQVTGAITSLSGSLDVPAGGTLAGTGSISKQSTLSGGTINFSNGGTISSTLGVSGGEWRGQGTVTGVVTVGNNTLTIGAGANLTANSGVNVSGGTFAAVSAASTVTGSVNYTTAVPGTWGGNIAGAGSVLTVNNAATLTLTGANTYGGGTNIADGLLIVTANNQLGSGNVTTGMVVVTPGSSGHGGTLQLSGGASYNLPLTIAGGGLNGVSVTPPGNLGALDNLSGDNTWAGTISLAGTGSSGNDPLENQIGARAGSLRLSGVIANAPSVTATWAKTGDGDVVLSGASANTYSGMTRLFGGRLILEKNGALGTAGVNNGTGGNTFQLAGSASTIAFRGGINYSTFEVINTEGTGAPGFGQVDSLSGNNTFAGQIAFGGPTPATVVESTIGVTSGSLEIGATGGLYSRGTGSAVRNITKLGAGSLILSGASGTPTANTAVLPLANSTININAGAVELRGATPATQVIPGVSTWKINSGATLQNTSGSLGPASAQVNTGGSLLFTGGSVSLTALDVLGGNVTVLPGGAKTLKATSVNLTGTGKVNLADNDFVDNYSGASPLGVFSAGNYDGVTGFVAKGNNGGTWNGDGIFTDQPDALTFLTTLAVGEAAEVLGISGSATTLWNQQTVDATSILVMYTYAGDLNLDGSINADDYAWIDLYSPVPGAFGYTHGDINYDGSINADDYATIDLNSTRQTGSFATGARPAPIATLTAVPEPSGLLVAAAAGSLLIRRRRYP